MQEAKTETVDVSVMSWINKKENEVQQASRFCISQAVYWLCLQ